MGGDFAHITTSIFITTILSIVVLLPGCTAHNINNNIHIDISVKAI
jgi:hypothetical protein